MPTEEKKYAIASNGDLQDRGSVKKNLRSKTRMLAIEKHHGQPNVFSAGGGDVETKSRAAPRKLAEGRMQNRAASRYAPLNASPAEALFNEGRPQGGLVFEREALTSSARTDRSRISYGPVPSTRIDVTRR